MKPLIERILERIAEKMDNYETMKLHASPNQKRLYMGKIDGLQLAESIIMDEYNKEEK